MNLKVLSVLHERHDIIRDNRKAGLRERRRGGRLTGAGRTYQGNGLSINRNGTRMQTCQSAQAQHESEHWSEQIGAGIFEAVVLGPVAPNLAALAFNGESHFIPIEKAEIISARKHTDAQARVAGHTVFWTRIKNFDGLRKYSRKGSPFL